MRRGAWVPALFNPITSEQGPKCSVSHPKRASEPVRSPTPLNLFSAHWHRLRGTSVLGPKVGGFRGALRAKQNWAVIGGGPLGRWAQQPQGKVLHEGEEEVGALRAPGTSIWLPVASKAGQTGVRMNLQGESLLWVWPEVGEGLLSSFKAGGSWQGSHRVVWHFQSQMHKIIN